MTAISFRTLLASALLAALSYSPALALDPPKGEPVLTIVGDHLSHPNVGQTAQFDLDMLENLAGRQGTMETPWTKGSVQFSGPLLKSVLEAAGAAGNTLTIKALNDYSAKIPMGDATDLDTMLATRMDGQLMSVRDKGPLFLIYPFDLDGTLYNEKYFARSVWQIKEIEVAE